MTTMMLAPGAEQDVDTKPVQISDEATRVLADKMREWSGWPTARLVFGKPTASPFAECDHNARTFTANPERLVLNPHRVLLTVTPFRLRQEAVLTGCLLHEAAHARHSRWAPRNAEQAAAFKHFDGEPVTRQTMALAKLMEEPRIEGIMSREADNIGAPGLGWTMRAAAAHLVPTTTLTMTDTGQQVMDVITSWALRAGRQIALLGQHPGSGLPGRTGYRLPLWVGDFNSLLHTVLLSHLESLGGIGSNSSVSLVVSRLTDMVCAGTDADRGTFMVDTARSILAILFPETDGDDESAPMPGGCQMEDSQPEEDSQSGDAESDEGEGEDEGESGVSDKPDTDEGDEGSGDAESDESEGDGDEQSEGDGEQSDEGDESDGDEQSDDGEQSEGESQSSQPESELARALREMEEQAKEQTEDEAEEEADAPPPQSGGASAGSGSDGTDGGGYRMPTSAERDVQRGAERFLRTLISPSESSKVVLTESPSATVDGAALASWKAGGMIRDPQFFRRTRRTIEPTPPVQIAVLVDVSGSMEELQKPSALLSWALSAAAIDLRNFAGRGQQVESCLIHWGSTARVIQHNGQPVPGIKEFDCAEGTYALDAALDLVAEEMPGFFDHAPDGGPVNRLLVQFTDWELSRMTLPGTTKRIRQALEVGVNMLSVVPRDYASGRGLYGGRSDLPEILAKCPVQRGSSTVLKYNPMFPEQVWDEASRALL